MPIPIYHITHINNLPSILKSGGLIANGRLRQEGINYLDIAHGGIQDRRAKIRVPCGADGVLHNYVPFYFAPRSPMLYAIHKGYVEGYAQGQNPVIHLVFEAEAIEASNLDFAFTDGHAVVAYSCFYNAFELLETVIDWEIMEATYWADTDEDGDKKRRRQAEFLVHNFCPWTLITKIGVMNITIQSQVLQMLQNFNHQPTVTVYPNWYY